jgi:hypothetical protein
MAVCDLKRLATAYQILVMHYAREFLPDAHPW